MDIKPAVYLFLAFSVLALAGCGGGGGGSSQTAYDDYFPLAVGNTWTYKVVNEGQNPLTEGFEMQYSISGTQEVGGRNTYIMSLESSRAFYFSDSSGVYLAGWEFEPYEFIGVEPPELILRYPIHKGYTWQSPDQRYTYTILSVAESVSTPAGTFANCVKVEEQFNGDGIGPEIKYYAPGVGLVKVESHPGAVSPDLPPATEIKMLISYDLS